MPELVDDPRFRRNEDRTANRDELRPLLVERLRTRPKMEWFGDIIAAGVPCGPINTIDQGVAFAEEVGLDPSSRGGGRRRRPVGAQPDHLLRHAGGTGCRHPRSTSTATRSAAGWRAGGEEPA